MNSFIKKIQTFSNRFDLLGKGSKIIVGVSGGPDSVCLLDVLNKLKSKYNLKIIIAHVNYGLRGKDSDGDEKFVGGLAEKYGLEIQVLNIKKNTSLLREGGRSPRENDMRDIRFYFFEKIRSENNFDVIAVAHNQDDQAETVLMRIIRGAGLQGLGSIRPKNGKIIRPLLKTSRKDILEYLKRNNLNYRIDKTNEDTKFSRNQVRHELIPFLEKEYNPVIKETLANAAGNISDDYDFISKKAKAKMDKICAVSENRVEIRISDIKELHFALQRQVIRLAILEAKKNLRDVENSHIEEIFKIIKSEKGKSQKVEFKGLKVVRKGDSIQISI